MLENSTTSQVVLGDETKKYLESHPQIAERLRKAEKTYKLFDEYLRLTQPRLIIRELGGASNSEVDPSAAVSRANS